MSIRIEDLRGQGLTSNLVRDSVPRAALDITEAAVAAAEIIEAVRTRGVAAISELSTRFDGFVAEPLWASQDELETALAELSPQLRQAIEESISRVRKASRDALPSTVTTRHEAGGTVTTRYVPIKSVGLYVPGGKAVYPSSVVMNVVPAQVAGSTRLVIATPGQKAFGGRAHPTVLATAKLLGVTDVLVIGGAAAIAALAYGVKQIGLAPVDLITGPGNIHVAAAKRLVRGTVGIDSEAGTTEILVLADHSANARFIALDLISQAEHDEAAACVLVTDSEALAQAVISHIDDLIPQATHSERIAVALSGQQSAVVLVDSIEAAIVFANEYATEHLEIVTDDDTSVLTQITNAGAIFVGSYSPVALGDYMAGSNHVLPTGGTARFNAGLGVHTFLRAQQVVDYSQSDLAEIAQKIETFARAEGLDAHGQAVSERLR